MEGIKARSRFVRKAREHLGERFTLIDVGCSDGIAEGWRAFGRALRAIGFDPDIGECERLARQEAADVEYIPAFVGLPDDHPFLRKRASSTTTARNPWLRLSTARTVELKSRSSGTARTAPPPGPRLADPGARVVLPEFFAARGLDDIDFVKIDVDGQDFEILVSLRESLASRRILAVGIEVNFYGSAAETDHTLHNVDRFLRGQGFDLFDLSVRRYSAAALPSRYLLPMPAQTEYGRPLQGDALYVRDLASEWGAEFAARLNAAKLLKCACIFELFNLPDCAAELIRRFEDRLELAHPRSLLDLLVPRNLPYGEYIHRFEADDPSFYVAPAYARKLRPLARRLVVSKLARRLGLTALLRR